MTADKYLYLDARVVKAEIAKLIETHPELADDPELRADAVEGETDAYRIIDRAVSQALEAEAMAEGLGLRMKDMSTRAGRFFAKAEAMRALVKNIMKAANLPRLTLPEASISLLAPKQSVGIEDLDELPQGYFKTVRQADKTAIKQALESGQTVPGAFLVLGSEGLRIQPK